MSYKTIDIAAPGKCLDGRDRPTEGRGSIPPNTEVRLIQAVGIHGYHRDGDCWVEHFDISRRRK